MTMRIVHLVSMHVRAFGTLNLSHTSAMGPFSSIKGLTYYRNNDEDPYITMKEVCFIYYYIEEYTSTLFRMTKRKKMSEKSSKSTPLTTSLSLQKQKTRFHNLKSTSMMTPKKTYTFITISCLHPSLSVSSGSTSHLSLPQQPKELLMLPQNNSATTSQLGLWSLKSKSGPWIPSNRCTLTWCLDDLTRPRRTSLLP